MSKQETKQESKKPQSVFQPHASWYQQLRYALCPISEMVKLIAICDWASHQALIPFMEVTSKDCRIVVIDSMNSISPTALPAKLPERVKKVQSLAEIKAITEADRKPAAAFIEPAWGTTDVGAFVEKLAPIFEFIILAAHDSHEESTKLVASVVDKGYKIVPFLGGALPMRFNGRATVVYKFMRSELKEITFFQNAVPMSTINKVQ